MTIDRTPLDTVRLGGADGPEIGVQGLGCMGMSFAYGPTDADEARATLERALELGVTLYDTADMYGLGENEKFIAPFVASHRDEVTVATKFAIQLDPQRPEWRAIRNDRPYIRQAVEGSLRRLGVEVIDLYYMHRRDPAVPIEETVGAMAELVEEGKVKQLGLSEVTGPELRAAHAVHPIAALQSEWSVFSRDVERTAVPTAAELGVTFVPYSPLGRGFLTGAVTSAGDLSADDFRRSLPRFTATNAALNAELLAPMRQIAEERSLALGQVALAWVHTQAEVHGLTVVPIPGTRRPGRVEENTAAAAVRLTAEELKQLEPLAERVSGERYPDMSGSSAGRAIPPGPGAHPRPRGAGERALGRHVGTAPHGGRAPAARRRRAGARTAGAEPRHRAEQHASAASHRPTAPPTGT